MGFGWLVEIASRRLDTVEVEGKGGCVRLRRVEGVAKVHDERVAPPVEPILYERVGEIGMVEQVCCSDLDRVCGPCSDVRMLGW